jgi:hypothetical protein
MSLFLPVNILGFHSQHRVQFLVTAEALNWQFFGCTVFIEILIFRQNDDDIFDFFLKKVANLLDLALVALIAVKIKQKSNFFPNFGDILLILITINLEIDSLIELFAELLNVISNLLQDLLVDSMLVEQLDILAGFDLLRFEFLDFATENTHLFVDYLVAVRHFEHLLLKVNNPLTVL